MSDQDGGFEAPVNPIPTVIVILTLIIVGVEMTLSAGASGYVGGPQAIGWRLAAFQDYAFSPIVLELLARGDYAFEVVKRFVTYPFVSGSFTEALFGAALTLALGKFVGETFRALPTLLIYFGSAIFGAVIFGLAFEGTTPLWGAFPPVYGLIGAYTYVIWLRLGVMGENQLSAFRLIGFLLALQLVFGLIFGGGNAWVAELSAFVFGFGISTVAAPGGWSALVARLRERSD